MYMKREPSTHIEGDKPGTFVEIVMEEPEYFTILTEINKAPVFARALLHC